MENERVSIEVDGEIFEFQPIHVLCGSAEYSALCLISTRDDVRSKLQIPFLCQLAGIDAPIHNRKTMADVACFLNGKSSLEPNEIAQSLAQQIEVWMNNVPERVAQVRIASYMRACAYGTSRPPLPSFLSQYTSMTVAGQAHALYTQYLYLRTDASVGAARVLFVILCRHLLIEASRFCETNRIDHQHIAKRRKILLSDESNNCGILFDEILRVSNLLRDQYIWCEVEIPHGHTRVEFLHKHVIVPYFRQYARIRKLCAHLFMYLVCDQIGEFPKRIYLEIK
jgi:hypothetical protein